MQDKVVVDGITLLLMIEITLSVSIVASPDIRRTSVGICTANHKIYLIVVHMGDLPVVEVEIVSAIQTECPLNNFHFNREVCHDSNS